MAISAPFCIAGLHFVLSKEKKRTEKAAFFKVFRSVISTLVSSDCTKVFYSLPLKIIWAKNGDFKSQMPSHQSSLWSSIILPPQGKEVPHDWCPFHHLLLYGRKMYFGQNAMQS